MSSFLVIIIDDGFTDQQEYMDYLEQKAKGYFDEYSAYMDSTYFDDYVDYDFSSNYEEDDFQYIETNI